VSVLVLTTCLPKSYSRLAYLTDADRKIHLVTNPDTEFDFAESFWRYELSLARLHNLPPPSQPPVIVTEPPLDLNCGIPSTAGAANDPHPSVPLDQAGRHYVAPAAPEEIASNTDRRASTLHRSLTTDHATVDAFSRLQTMFHEVRSRAASPDDLENGAEVPAGGRVDGDSRNIFDGSDLMAQVMGIEPTMWESEIHGGLESFPWTH